MSEDFERYLYLLGIRRKKPGINELKRIVHAHITKIPFENISKLYYFLTLGLKDIPSLSQFLDGIEDYHFGGTCYTCNYHLNQLLKFLGYNVVLCSADMNRPDVHLLNLVTVEGREFIVDTGYAAPFLNPLPRDLDFSTRISLGTDEYILSPTDGSGRSQLSLLREGILRHGYLVNPTPRHIEEFAEVVSDSFRPEATFMNCLLLVRFSTGSSWRIQNMTLIESTGKKVKRKLFSTTEEVVDAIEKIFLIPSRVSRIALEGLSMSGGPWH